MNRCEGIYFLQKPFTTNTEQLGCYYFNILEAIEYCRKQNPMVPIVPPRLPLCPRDNTKVELYSNATWDTSIRGIGSVDSREVLDYTNIVTLTLDEFHYRSNGNVCMKDKVLDISGIPFTLDRNSKFWVIDLPSRWDLQGNDHHIFYNILYPILPLNPTILEGRIPEWYVANSKKPFLGVHWRRGDRGNIKVGRIGELLWRSTNPIHVAAYISEYCSKNPELEWVYVSTNSGSEADKKQLQSLVIRPIYYYNAPIVTPFEQWKWDIADLLLCARAKHLLLSPGNLQNSSAFGRLMYAECLQQNPTDALVSFIPLI